MTSDWLVSFDVAGVFLPEEIQLTREVLVTSSETEELLIDKVVSVRQVQIRIPQARTKEWENWDIAKFGTNKFGSEDEFGVAEKVLTSALAFYTVRTGYPTEILRRRTGQKISVDDDRHDPLPNWRQLTDSRRREGDINALRTKTREVRAGFPEYSEIISKNPFLDLATRYYWLGKNSSQDHNAFLDFVISLEILFLVGRGASQIQHRVALALGLDDESQFKIYKTIKAVYKTRNRIVHEGSDLIDYEELNFLDANIPRLVESVTRLLTLADTKRGICEMLDNALIQNDLRQRIRRTINSSR